MQTPNTQGLLRQAKPAWPQPNKVISEIKENSQMMFEDVEEEKVEAEAQEDQNLKNLLLLIEPLQDNFKCVVAVADVKVVYDDIFVNNFEDLRLWWRNDNDWFEGVGADSVGGVVEGVVEGVGAIAGSADDNVATVEVMISSLLLTLSFRDNIVAAAASCILLLIQDVAVTNDGDDNVDVALKDMTLSFIALSSSFS